MRVGLGAEKMGILTAWLYSGWRVARRPFRDMQARRTQDASKRFSERGFVCVYPTSYLAFRRMYPSRQLPLPRRYGEKKHICRQENVFPASAGQSIGVWACTGLIGWLTICPASCGSSLRLSATVAMSTPLDQKQSLQTSFWTLRISLSGLTPTT